MVWRQVESLVLDQPSRRLSQKKRPCEDFTFNGLLMSCDFQKIEDRSSKKLIGYELEVASKSDPPFPETAATKVSQLVELLKKQLSAHSVSEADIKTLVNDLDKPGVFSVAREFALDSSKAKLPAIHSHKGLLRKSGIFSFQSGEYGQFYSLLMECTFGPGSSGKTALCIASKESEFMDAPTPQEAKAWAVALTGLEPSPQTIQEFLNELVDDSHKFNSYSFNIVVPKDKVIRRLLGAPNKAGFPQTLTFEEGPKI